MTFLPRAKKSLGQNFLVDRNVLARIVDIAELTENDRVLEVGPGRGALTTGLADTAAAVVSVELDRDLIDILKTQFLLNNNVEIIQGDILEVDLKEILTSRWQGKWKVIANLPYNISSQVLFRFIDHYQLFNRLVLMLQKEVGDRLVASPATKDYGIITVFCSLYFDISRELVVKPGSFKPVPKVDSVVLSFKPLDKPRVDVGDERFFRRVVKASFSQRRKTLWNCLKAAAFGLSDDILRDAMHSVDIDPGRRGETLTLVEFAELTKALDSRIKGGI